MKNTIEFSKIPHPLIRDGRSQDERQVPALDPKQAPLNDRSMADMLNYIYHYAKQIHYYNEKNKTAGNWQSFFDLSDPFLMAKISQYEVSSVEEDYQRKSNQLLNESIPENVLPLFDRIFELASEINNWGKNMTRDTSLKRTVNNVIASNLQYAFKELIGYANAAFAKTWLPSNYPIDYKKFSSNWNINVSDQIHINASFIKVKGSESKQLLIAKEKLDDLFNTFVKAIIQIRDSAPDALNTLLNDVESKNHSPHIALLLAFLRMFEQSQQDLNLIAQRHLDFFYKKILELTTKEARLDQAHLVLKLAPNRPNYELKKGSQFSAGEDDLGAEMLFELNEDIVLSQAQIASLKTLAMYPAEYELIDGEQAEKGKENLFIQGLYAAPIANSADGLGTDFTDENNISWPALGHAISKCPEENIPTTLKPMPFAQQGFVLASRVLLLNEGDRLISITIPLSFIENLPEGTDLEGAINSKIEIITKAQSEPGESTEEILQAEGLSDNVFDENVFDVDLLHNKIHAPVVGAELSIEDKLILINHIPRKHTFKVTLSGAESWIEPLDLRVKIEINTDTDSKVEFPYQLTFDIGLDPTMPAVTFADAEILETDYQVDLPLVKIELDPSTTISLTQNGYASDVCLYQLFRKADLGNIEITTDVKGVKNLILQNDESILDPSKPFLPFGTLPNQGANFFIGSAEIFSKKLDNFSLNMKWDKLPGSFTDHYGMYFPTDEIGGEINFSAQLQMLKAGQWDPIPEDGIIPENLFDDVSNPTPAITIASTDNKKYNSGFTGKKLRPFTPETLSGFIKLELLTPNGFKHNLYGERLALQALAIAERSKSGSPIVVNALYKGNNDPFTVVAAIGGDNLNPGHTPYLPKEPYTPTVKEFSVDYTATAEKKDLTFLHLYPYEHTFLKVEASESTLLPQFKEAESNGEITEKEGRLLIGLSDLQPNSVLHILFQVAESTANPDLDQAEIDWYYLRDNEWKLLRKDFEVLQDDTQGLINSGIVTLAIPADINKNNTILSSDFHWVKVATAKNSGAISEIIGVHAQAAKVYFKDENNDLSRLAQPLAAGSIKELKVNESGIAEFSQLYDSFGGVSAEKPLHFYTRVSEHLRHKGRAITLFDYERLVLEAFPELFKVKCIPHTLGRKIQEPFKKKEPGNDEDRDYELSPGFVTLAVIPNLSNIPTANQLQPKVTLSKLKEIKRFLAKKISPFVRLRILNPKYETIHVRTNVVFAEGRSNAFYTEKLKEDILRFLTPWAYDEPGRISFGGKVYKSAILNYVEQREYVDYVFDFKIMDQSLKPKDVISAQSARSILVSGIHEITASDSCSLDNSNRIEGIGIGFEKIGSTFALSDDTTPCDPEPNCHKDKETEIRRDTT